MNSSFRESSLSFWVKGYDTGVVDAHEYGDAAHDAGPLPLELMGFPEVAVDTGVQQADDSWNTQRKTTAR